MGAILKLALKAGLGFATGGASGIATWALKHWRLALALIVALVIGISFKVVLHERDSARATVAADAKTITTLTSQKTALQANVMQLTATIKTQSDSIDALRRDAHARQDAANAAMLAAKAKNAKDTATIAALRKRAADSSNGGTCDAEIARIRAGL